MMYYRQNEEWKSSMDGGEWMDVVLHTIKWGQRTNMLEVWTFSD